MAGIAETGARAGRDVRRHREGREDDPAVLEGAAILALDPKTASDTAGAVLDVQEESLGLRLFLIKQGD